MIGGVAFRTVPSIGGLSCHNNKSDKTVWRYSCLDCYGCIPVTKRQRSLAPGVNQFPFADCVSAVCQDLSFKLSQPVSFCWIFKSSVGSIYWMCVGLGHSHLMPAKSSWRIINASWRVDWWFQVPPIISVSTNLIVSGPVRPFFLPMDHTRTRIDWVAKIWHLNYDKTVVDRVMVCISRYR